jgi:TP901 family phage tail tape measure protein
MAAMTTVLKAIITADATQMKTQLAAAESSLSSFGKKTSATGKMLTKRLTMPIGLVGGASIKMASDFEASMTKIQSLVGLSAETVQGFEEDVRSLSGVTAQAPKDLADAMFFITSAGIRGAAATQTLEAAAKASAVGLGEVATIADLATSALNAYGTENFSASEATDVMVAAVREGKLEASELAGSMGRVLPIASAMGVQFNEVGAAFAALSRTGTNAAEAATQVRGILASLLRPTKQSEEALTSMGLSSADLRSQIKEKGLLSVLKTLAVEFDGQSEKAAAVFGNIRALSGVMDLLGKNSAATEAIFASMTDTTGALDDAFAITSDTTAFKLQQAMADMKMALVNIGEVLIPIIIPALEKVAGVVTSAADGFSKMPNVLKKVTTGFILLAAAAGPAMRIVGGGATMMASKIPAFANLSTQLGAAKGKGLVGRLGVLGKVMKGNLVATAALGVGIFAATKIIGGMRQRAQEAKERMETLRGELISSGDPTVTLTDDFKELAEAIGKVTEEADGPVPDIKKFAGEATLTADLLKKGLNNEFEALGLNMEELMPLLSTGTDEFHKFGDETKAIAKAGDVDAFAEALRNADESIRPYTTALAEAVEQGKLTTKQARQIHISMDDTADAFDDAENATKKSTKEFLESEEALGFFTKAFGELGANMLETTREADDQVAALQNMYHMMAQSQEMDLLNANITELAGVTEEASISLEDVQKPMEDFRKTSEMTAEEIAEVRGEFDKLVARLDEVVSDAFDLDLAMLKVQDTFVDLAEAIAGLNDEEKTQLERQTDLVKASQEVAQAIADTVQTFDDLTDPAVNEFLQTNKERLDELKKVMPEEEFQRLVDVLFELEKQVDVLNNIDAMIDVGINFSGLPPELMQIMGGAALTPELISATTSVVGGKLAGFGSFADGGIITQPTLGLIGEAGPEAVIPLNQMGSMGGNTNVTINMPAGVDGQAVVDAIEAYARENGAAPIATTALVRQ